MILSIDIELKFYFFKKLIISVNHDIKKIKCYVDL